MTTVPELLPHRPRSFTGQRGTSQLFINFKRIFRILILKEMEMKPRGWILLGIGGIVATYVVLNHRLFNYPAVDDDLETVANRTAGWGSKQRMSGTGRNLLGKMKEGFGRVTGDHDLAEEGVADQVTGAVKDTASRAAHVASDFIHDLNR